MTYPEIPHIRRASRDMVRRLGLVGGGCDGLPTSHSHTLIELETLGDATAGQLADILCLDKSSISRIITKLEQEGLIQRVDDHSDKRQKRLRLTEKGKKRLITVHSFANKPVENALALLRPAQRTVVQEGLQLYARALARARAQEGIHLRPIQPQDNPAVATIIRQSLEEYGAVGPGYSHADPEIDVMFETYQREGALFLVIERNDRVLGGGGIAPLAGGDATQCELQKMYFLPEIRGIGIGATIIRHCLDFAREAGYTTCYLETLETMERARRLYRSFGFTELDSPLGDTGHCRCDAYFAKDLTQ